jgi:steroid delta-isomerase-like uncharacterized protein
MTAGTSPRSIVTDVYRAFDDGDVDAVDRLFAADLVDHNAVPGAPTARDGIRGLVAAVRDGFAGAQHEVLYLGETADGWVVSSWRMTGTHCGPWFGTPASGRTVSFAGTDLYRIADGQIVEMRHVEELLQLQAQIG